MNEEFSWPPLESDPEVLNNYLKALGVHKDFSFQEVISFEHLNSIDTNIMAILCLYQCDKTKGQSKVTKGDFINSNQISFYIRQVNGLDKACGLIAILNCLGNIEEITFENKSIIETFFRETKSLNKDAVKIGEYLLNYTQFHQLHKEYSNLGQSSISSYKIEKKSNHFVAFMNKDEILIEFNGGKDGPQIIKKNTTQNNLLKDVIEEMNWRLKECLITERMSLICLEKKEHK
jgi:ubiquitin carboxyl-terminal hydrolase L3